MGWIEQRGKRWRGRVRVGTETLSTDTAPTKTEAKRLLRELEVELDRGTWVDPRAGEVSFDEWVTAWRRTRGTLEVSSRRADEGRLSTHLLPAFGELALADVTPMRVRTWVSELAQVRAPKTVRNCHALLHTVLEAAVDEGLLRKNPCVGTRLPVAARHDQVCLTEPELERLIAAFDDGWPRALVLLLAGTGLRWGEAVGLKVGRVDLLKRELRVRQTLTEVDGRLAWKDKPKSKKGYRTVSLPAAVVDALIPLVTAKDGEDLVFRGDPECTGSCYHCTKARAEGRDVVLVHAIRNRTFRRRHWDRCRDAAGITSKPTPHDLRHTHAALLISAGSPLTAVQYRLGHDSIQITSDTYGYLMPRVDEELVAVLDDVFSPARGRARADVGAAAPGVVVGAELGEFVLDRTGPDRPPQA